MVWYAMFAPCLMSYGKCLMIISLIQWQAIAYIWFVIPVYRVDMYVLFCLSPQLAHDSAYTVSDLITWVHCDLNMGCMVKAHLVSYVDRIGSFFSYNGRVRTKIRAEWDVFLGLEIERLLPYLS